MQQRQGDRAAHVRIPPGRCGGTHALFENDVGDGWPQNLCIVSDVRLTLVSDAFTRPGAERGDVYLPDAATPATLR
jgi:hypothetical protein